MAQRVDAVVVGAGPNGLAAAIRLARAGREVVVCEAQPLAGGAVRSEALTLPGFVHDTFSAVHPAGAASPVFSRLPLAEHGLEWIEPEVALAHPLTDGRAGILHRDLDRTAQHLDGLRTGDGAAWRGWAGPLLEHFEGLRATMLAGFPPVKGAARYGLAAGPGGLLELGRTLLMPAASLADELFAGPHARAWLYGTALHGDVPVDDAGSAITAGYLKLLGHVTGWPSPRGGAGALTEALVAHLASLGGEVRVSTPVVRVVTGRGRVAGVVTAAGERLRTPVVVADTSPRGLLELVGDAMPSRYTRRLADFRYGPGTVKIDWALDGPVPWTAEVTRRAGTVHVGGGPDEVAAPARTVRAGRLPERPFLLLGQQTVADPTRAPAGRHTAWAYTRVPPDTAGEAVAGHVERMTDQVERFAPGFRDLVLARHVQGPAELEAGDANLVRGDVGGGSQVLHQTVFRPVPRLVPYATPIRGLWLGSASTFPGGGVHGVCGWTAAGYALAAARIGLA